MKKKSLALLLSLVLVLGIVAGSSLAWLTAKDEPVVNVFTDSDINIELTETTGEDYKMIPGWTIEKDPIITVKEGSEDCWVFIKVEESASPKLDDYIEYEIDPNNWEQLKDNDNNDVAGVYVGKVACKDIDADRSIKILLNNQVTVKDSVTKEMMDAIDDGADQPKLSFTAYASQYWKNNTESFGEYEAWLNISDANANGTPDSEEVTP